MFAGDYADSGARQTPWPALLGMIPTNVFFQRPWNEANILARDPGVLHVPRHSAGQAAQASAPSRWWMAPTLCGRLRLMINKVMFVLFPE